jgi:putative Ca2+/H+ antiporter (TMEM165/GDT1 family)
MAVKFTNPWWVVAGGVAGLFVCNGPVLGFTPIVCARMSCRICRRRAPPS